jgi:hypothetical protein
MKDRLLTLALALGAFAAFYGYFIGPRQQAADESSRPISTETRANGYFALRHWLETEGLPVTELRQRYDWLQKTPTLPRRGNLLVTTIPHERPMRVAEQSALVKWISSGNSVLVLAGIFDTPEWGVPDLNSPQELHRISGLWLQPYEDAEEGDAQAEGEEADEGEDAETAAQAVGDLFTRLDEPKRGAMRPIGEHPLTRGVTVVHAVSEYEAGKFEVLPGPREPALALLDDEESGLAAFWVTWNGRGAVYVSGYGSVFTNKMLAEAGNAQLAANIVAAGVAPGGHVIFDDMHQGAASVYDAEAFFGDPRLHASFWWIMALWLVWVIGGTRLPPPASRPAPVRERGFVHATGNFFARALGRRRAAERLLAEFFDDCRRARGDAEGSGPPWDWVRGFGAVPRGEIDRLEALHARVEAGRRVDLVDLHNRLQQLRKQLA